MGKRLKFSWGGGAATLMSYLVCHGDGGGVAQKAAATKVLRQRVQKHVELWRIRRMRLLKNGSDDRLAGCAVLARHADPKDCVMSCIPLKRSGAAEECIGRAAREANIADNPRPMQVTSFYEQW